MCGKSLPDAVDPEPAKSASRAFSGAYRGEYLDQVAFPLGGIGAGMFCLEGSGALTKFSIHNRPELTTEPWVFAAVAIKGARSTARVLEGPLPKWKLRPSFVARYTVRRWGRGVCRAFAARRSRRGFRSLGCAYMIAVCQFG